MRTKAEWIDAIDESLERWAKKEGEEVRPVRGTECALCALCPRINGMFQCRECVVTAVFRQDCHAYNDTPVRTYEEDGDTDHAILSLLLLREIVEGNDANQG